MNPKSQNQDLTDRNFALTSAIKARDAATVSSLLDLGADPNTTTDFDPYGFGSHPVSALMLALTWHCRREVNAFDGSEQVSEPIVCALIRSGADLNDHSFGDATPLGIAVQFGMGALAEFMLAQGADPNAVVHAIETPLIIACIKGDVEMARLLLDAGADANDTRGCGPPLRVAVKSESVEVVAMLLAHGVDVNHRTRSGQTALLAAQGRKRSLGQIRKMLEAAGAQLDQVELECNRLFKAVQKHDEVEAEVVDRCKTLWSENVAALRLGQIPIHRAHALCHLGCIVAEQTGAYMEGVGIIDLLLSHQDAATLSIMDKYELLESKLYFMLMSDQEADAVRYARQMLSQVESSVSNEDWYCKSTIRGALIDFLTAANEEQKLASVELTALAWDVSQALSKCPLKRKRPPERASHQELLAILRRR